MNFPAGPGTPGKGIPSTVAPHSLHPVPTQLQPVAMSYPQLQPQIPPGLHPMALLHSHQPYNAQYQQFQQVQQMPHSFHPKTVLTSSLNPQQLQPQTQSQPQQQGQAQSHRQQQQKQQQQQQQQLLQVQAHAHAQAQLQVQVQVVSTSNGSSSDHGADQEGQKRRRGRPRKYPDDIDPTALRAMYRATHIENVRTNVAKIRKKKGTEPEQEYHTAQPPEVHNGHPFGYEINLLTRANEALASSQLLHAVHNIPDAPRTKRKSRKKISEQQEQQQQPETSRPSAPYPNILNPEPQVDRSGMRFLPQHLTSSSHNPYPPHMSSN